MDELKYWLLIGILSNHGISAQKAWDIPYQLKSRLDKAYHSKLSISELDKLNQEQVIELYKYPYNLHRFNNKMAIYSHQLVTEVNEAYQRAGEELLPVDNNQQLITNVANLPGMSVRKARHFLVYLTALDSEYSITEKEYLQYTKDCPQLVEKFETNIAIFKQVEYNNHK